MPLLVDPASSLRNLIAEVRFFPGVPMKVDFSEHVLCPLCVKQFEEGTGVFSDKHSIRNVLEGTLIDSCQTWRYCCRCGSEHQVVATFKQPEGEIYPCDGKHEEVTSR